MKCQFCNAEIADNALFCTSCGKKQEKKVEEPKVEMPTFCTKCGTKLKDGAMFCVGCGAKVEPKQVVAQEKKPVEQPKQQASKPKQPVAPTKQVEVGATPQPQVKPSVKKEDTSKTSGGMVALIVVLVIVLLALIGVGVGLAVKTFSAGEQSRQTESADKDKDDNEDEKDEEDEATTEVATEGETSDATEAPKDEANANVDVDLGAVDEETFTGKLQNGTGGMVIKLAEPISIMTKDEETIENVKVVYIDDFELPDGMLQWIKVGKKITVTGEPYYMSGSLYVTAVEIADAKGKDMIDQYENMDDDYVIPNSDTVRLTEEDIEDLTLQELNYAKNEIYARHGRKFDSKELRDYFNSKSWYNGTIDPSDFSDSMLSNIERANVTLIKNAEFAIDSRGYQLDQ